MTTPPLSKSDLTPEYIAAATGDELRWAVALCKCGPMGVHASKKGGDTEYSIDPYHDGFTWQGACMDYAGDYQGPNFLAWSEAGPLLVEMNGHFYRSHDGWTCTADMDRLLEESPVDAPTTCILRVYCQLKIAKEGAA